MEGVESIMKPFLDQLKNEGNGNRKFEKPTDPIVEEIKSESIRQQRSLKNGLCPMVSHKELTFDNFKVETPEQEKALIVCKKFACNFLKREIARQKMRNDEGSKFPSTPWRKENALGLFLFGNFGTGKTFLANAIINELESSGVYGYYIRIPDLFDKINDRQSGVNTSEVMQTLAAIPCLILDEIGVQAGTDAEKRRLYQIIDSRIDRGRPTVLITNLSRSELVNCLTPRVYDRVSASTYPVAFLWDSLREPVAVNEQSLFE